MKHLLSIVLFSALVGVCYATDKKDDGQEYHMPSAEFAKKFGIAPGVVPHAPQATLAPIPPFPFKMREKNLNGWSAYVVRIDAKGTVKAADLVAYSRKEFGNGRESLLKWRFGGIAKEGLYHVLLRYTLSPSGAMVDQVYEKPNQTLQPTPGS